MQLVPRYAIIYSAKGRWFYKGHHHSYVPEPLTLLRLKGASSKQSINIGGKLTGGIA